MSKLTKHFLILGLLLITSCGFKVLNQNELNNFNIEKITTNGEKRINLKLKIILFLKLKTIQIIMLFLKSLLKKVKISKKRI
mgnify:CR=1 FL=1